MSLLKKLRIFENCFRTRYQTFTSHAKLKTHSDPKACHVVGSPGDTVVSPRDYQDTATLYVHWPYCQRRCTYCNFNKYINNTVDHARMKQCIVQEADTLIHMSGVKRIKSVFFGGGTPSLARPDLVESLLDSLKSYLVDDAEVTLECNPTSTESAKLHEFQSAGVNRISLGLQALCDEDLQVLGRDHSVEQSLQCLDIAKKMFEGRTSVDIMFGRPGQTLLSWQHELSTILNMCDDHISLYELTLERGTDLFKKVTQNLVTVPDGQTNAAMYQHAVDTLTTGGWSQYEVSNFAINGAESQHNMSYWSGDLYIGVGPGAHGRFVYNGCREARIQTLEPGPWMSEVEKYGHGTRRRVQQSIKDCLCEILMLGLRTKVGIRNQTWELFTDKQLQEIFGNSDVVKNLWENQLLVLDSDGLRATPSGLTVIDSILPDLYLHMEEYMK